MFAGQVVWRSPRAAAGGLMRKFLLVLFLTALWCNAAQAGAQDKLPAAFDLAEFLARYESGLKPLERLYVELANENLPLRDEAGLPLARRHTEDRRQALSELLRTVHELALAPQDLFWATKLFSQSEALTDDLFDLSQVAYDNNREELGKQLSELVRVMDHHNALIESYALRVVAEKQERLRQLEKENQELRQKLQELTEQSKGVSHSP
jgi:hypothetical protein